MHPTATEQRLGEMYRALQTKPIAPDHPHYVRIWEDLPHDPVARLRTHIEWSEVESLQFFSGFRGAGKSTQLLRLKRDLEQAGYLVIYSDAEGYLNLNEPIDITDLLLTVAGAFSDGLETAKVPFLKGESYWTRLINYLNKTNVHLGEFSVPAGDIEFKAELRTTLSFRQQLQKHLAGRLHELLAEVRKFIGEGTEAVRTSRGDGARVVLLFDSLEKLYASPSNAQEMMGRLERLFRSHLAALKLPWIHTVYSIPPWLRWVIAEPDPVVIPSVKLQPSRHSDGPYEQGWSVLRKIIERRMTPDGLRLVFGAPDANGNYPLADKLVTMSGGAPRDLLRLFSETLLLAASNTLPVSETLVDSAIAGVKNSFKINLDDAQWLARVDATKSFYPQSSDTAELSRLMRLFDNHFILLYQNNVDWYGIHPLVRDEVLRITQPASSGPAE